MRKYRRNRASSSPDSDDSSNGFNLLNIYKKRGANAPTTGVFEKEGDHGAHEKDGSDVTPQGQVHEVQGSSAWTTPMSPGESWVSGEERHPMIVNPVELPSRSDHLS